MLEQAVDLRAVVRHYIPKHRPRSHAELHSYRAEPSLEAAVRRAALTILADGRRDPHHARRPQELLERAEARLVERLPAIEAAADFARLYQVIDKAVGHWTGLGDLYVYDTALRIGAKKGVFPKVVHLHAGTREGAQKLLDVKERKTLFPSELIEVARRWPSSRRTRSRTSSASTGPAPRRRGRSRRRRELLARRGSARNLLIDALVSAVPGQWPLFAESGHV